MKNQAGSDQCATALSAYRDRGWVLFDRDDRVQDWIDRYRADILATRDAPENALWHRYGGTWFAGVNVLPNDPLGRIGDGPPLTGAAVDFAASALPFGRLPLDRAQVSICKPGYPEPMPGESDAVFAFRRDRDAAHLDGLLKHGSDRRRFLKEMHGYILGLPITKVGAGAAPFSIWEGSHRLIGDWLRDMLGDLPTEAWGDIDLTAGYQAIRRTVFETCRRVEITAAPGQAYLVHRHAIHGMARWREGAEAEAEGRVIVYFRPPVETPTTWLAAD